MRVISYLEVQMVAGPTKLVLYAQIRRLKVWRIKTGEVAVYLVLLRWQHVLSQQLQGSQTAFRKQIPMKVALASDDGIHVYNNPK